MKRLFRITNVPQTKVTRAPVRGTRYTVHDGVWVNGTVTARCSVVSMRHVRWHLLEGHTTTTCKRCLAIRRWLLCTTCDAELTETDLAVGYCTQCGTKLLKGEAS